MEGTSQIQQLATLMKLSEDGVREKDWGPKTKLSPE